MRWRYDEPELSKSPVCLIQDVFVDLFTFSSCVYCNFQASLSLSLILGVGWRT